MRCKAHKKNGKRCSYQAKFGCYYCGIHRKSQRGGANVAAQPVEPAYVRREFERMINLLDQDFYDQANAMFPPQRPLGAMELNMALDRLDQGNMRYVIVRYNDQESIVVFRHEGVYMVNTLSSDGRLYAPEHLMM